MSSKINGYLQPKVLTSQPWRDNLDGATFWFFPNAPGDVEVTVVLASDYAALEAEQDRLAVELARRDEKWKAGILQCCGRDINFDALEPVAGVPTLDQFVRQLRQDRDTLAREVAGWKRAIRDGALTYVDRLTPELTDLRQATDDSGALMRAGFDNRGYLSSAASGAIARVAQPDSAPLS